MSTLLWFVGLGLMMTSFAFLFSKPEERTQPRITVEPLWPDRETDHKPTPPPASKR